MIADEVNMNQKPFIWYWLKNWGWEKFVTRWYPGISSSNSEMLGWAQFLTFKCITVRLQPPYSPDLAHCDFFLFQKIKSAVKGHHFESTEYIQKSVMQVLNDIPQAAFQECYKEWQHRWKRWPHCSWWI